MIWIITNSFSCQLYFIRADRENIVDFVLWMKELGECVYEKSAKWKFLYFIYLIYSYL